MRILILILTIGFIFSCNNSNNETKEAPSDILALVGSESITKDDLRDELNKLSYKQRSIYSSSPEKLNKFLDTHINEKVLYNEAIKRGFANRGDIQEEIDRYKKQLIIKTFGKEILGELELNNDDITMYYDQNKKEFERIQISKIFIKTNPENGISSESALSKAELVSSKANAGESFEELALEYSDDPISKKKGGKVGYINRGKFPQQIDNQIFELKEGEITKPFEVQDGYLIIKANQEPDFPPYGQVERIIRSKLINERLLNYINGLREQWGVRVYKDRLQEIIKSEPK
ncbi:MAG: peptidylprolyl isomerase [Candidatus Dadabacteria bacterium]|jgi:peptidyl-prolyl cis-trans isomerase C|nr:peptidylprolyl isomerase [Candidatus Dadabacteria bacterium]MCZ6685936.1 peptidylprolyl isomerase [Candidatus Dadabacteria bacterium]